MHAGYFHSHWYDPTCPSHAHNPDAHHAYAVGGRGFYFFDECELPVGPYKTFEEAEQARKDYRP